MDSEPRTIESTGSTISCQCISLLGHGWSKRNKENAMCVMKKVAQTSQDVFFPTLRGGMVNGC